MILPHDEAGRGPALVLLHAGIADRTMWADHLQPFAHAGYRVVAVDLPGYGDTPVATGEQAPWNDVVDTMDELSIGRATLIGNSLGGAVALRVAVVAPERVASLVLISAPSPTLEPSPELAAAWDAEETALDRGDVDAAVDIILAAWTLPDAPEDLRCRIAAMLRRALALQADAPPTTEAPDPLALDPSLVSRVGVPALVAAGERDLVDFRQAARDMAAMLPAGRHAVIAEAGHLAPLETPGAFRELVLRFVG